MLTNSVDGLDFYFVENTQWIFSGIYPDYKELEFLYEELKSNKDIHLTTSTVRGKQTLLKEEIWRQQRGRYQEWILDSFATLQCPIVEIMYRNFNEIEVPTDIDVTETAWIIEYEEHGHQTGHFHSTERMHQNNPRFGSSVLFFDKIEPTEEYKSNGCLWTILQDPKGYTFQHMFHPDPGRCVVMDDRVFHGAYPTTKTRRCLVWDFDYRVEFK